MADEQTTIDEAMVKREAQKIASRTDLSTESLFRTAVQEQLDKLQEHYSSQLQKRHKTIIRLAEVEINPVLTRNDAFKSKETISQRVFYDTQKDWFHDLPFRQVLENVIAIYIRWDNERDLREMANEQRAWKEKMKTVSWEMIQKAEEMMDFPLTEIEVIDDGEGGETTIVKPANWRVGDIPAIVKTADQVGRLARGLDTEQTAVAVDATIQEVNKEEEVEQTRQSIRAKLRKIQSQLIKQEQPEEVEAVEEEA